MARMGWGPAPEASPQLGLQSGVWSGGGGWRCGDVAQRPELEEDPSTSSLSFLPSVSLVHQETVNPGL